jgi:hypothetical protein
MAEHHFYHRKPENLSEDFPKPITVKMAELFIEINKDVNAYEKKQKVIISNENKIFLITELFNSCINRGVSYKDNPLRKTLFSLPWKEEKTRV